jgi:carbonic anhydrase
VTGGPVKGDYHFLQFHMHWGYGSKDKGSEHLIDGRAYAAELHFVNWNSTAFTDPKLASSSSKNDGLLVMSVLVDVRIAFIYINF